MMTFLFHQKGISPPPVAKKGKGRALFSKNAILWINFKTSLPQQKM